MSKIDTRMAKQDKMKTSQKQLTLAATSPPRANDGESNGESEVLAELRELKQENGESFRDTKLSLNRLESP